jgi:pseudomonalisin
MRTLLSAAAVAAIAAAAAAPAGASGLSRYPAGLRQVTPQASTGWANTATKAMLLVKATDLGAVPNSLPLRLVVGLTMRDKVGAMNLVHQEHNPRSSMYHKTVTPAQFTAAFNPTGTQVNAVATYLAKQGFQNISAEPNNLMITATATAGQARAAFNTDIHSFKQFGHVIYAQVKPAQVPTALGGTVAAVLGLNNISLRHPIKGSFTNPHPSASPPPNPPPDSCFLVPIAGSTDCIRSYLAKDFQKAYNGFQFTSINHTHSYTGLNSTTGINDSIAVFAEGNLAPILPDLRKYELVSGIPQVPYSIVRVGVPSPDTAGDIEWDLDSQSSTGIAQLVRHIYMYDTTSLTDSDTGLEFNRFAVQDIARMGNASFGECETFPFVDGAMVLDDEVFLEAAGQGQTVFSSSGDNGSGCPVVISTGIPASGPPGVSYPASSPYVVAVGGTTLVTDQKTFAYGGEKAWEGSGGGPSMFENEPYWQKGVTIPAFDAAGIRQVPDISMDADPDTGAIIIVNGQEFFVGGTSLSSPLSMGTYARLMTAHGDEMGFASPFLYYEYRAFPAPTLPAVPMGPLGFETNLVGGFHDIYTSGNGQYTALPRYDLVTGLGTLHIGHQTVDIDLINDGDGQ